MSFEKKVPDVAPIKLKPRDEGVIVLDEAEELRTFLRCQNFLLLDHFLGKLSLMVVYMFPVLCLPGKKDGNFSQAEGKQGRANAGVGDKDVGFLEVRKELVEGKKSLPGTKSGFIIRMADLHQHRRRNNAFLDTFVDHPDEAVKREIFKTDGDKDVHVT